MATWRAPEINPSSNRANLSQAEYDMGLRAFMLNVYNIMGLGILLTGVVAWSFASFGITQQLLTNSILRWVIILSPLAIVMVMSFGSNRMSTGTLHTLFWAFAGLMGVSMSSIFLVYTGSSIAQTFFVTAIAFFALSLFGYTTKRDLSGWGSFLFMGLIGIIAASLFNIFLGSGTLQLVISVAGVLIFAGLTAYDTQRIKSMYNYVAGTDYMGKFVILSALSLYLDFINMFQFLLSFLGNSE